MWDTCTVQAPATSTMPTDTYMGHLYCSGPCYKYYAYRHLHGTLVLFRPLLQIPHLQRLAAAGEAREHPAAGAADRQVQASSCHHHHLLHLLLFLQYPGQENDQLCFLSGSAFVLSVSFISLPVWGLLIHTFMFLMKVWQLLTVHLYCQIVSLLLCNYLLLLLVQKV